MNRSKVSLVLIVLFISTTSLLSQHQLTNFDYPTKVDTKDHPIQQQEKKVFKFMADGVKLDNKFDGARVNGVSRLEKNRYEITITAENEPINPSPWYAFRISAEDSRTVEIELEYGKANHRYWPKISADGKNWTRIDSANFEVLKGRKRAKMTLDIGTKVTWISGQEIISSTDITNWAKQFTNVDDTKFEAIGKSKLGRDLVHLDIKDGSTRNKEIIAVVSRQHPPEVTGNMAMIAFIEEILNDSDLSKRFRDKYRVLVYPMLNPDGVDLGHWRHNAGGIDLNRDWAEYNQPEIRQICENIIKKANAANSEVILGLDFHSTYSDVYYTIADSIQTVMPTFANDWIGEIEKNLEGFNARVSPAALTSPVSKNWFYNEFKAVGIVYEIGDSTPRNIIKKKGEVSAREMMKLLLERK